MVLLAKWAAGGQGCGSGEDMTLSGCSDRSPEHRVKTPGELAGLGEPLKFNY